MATRVDSATSPSVRHSGMNVEKRRQEMILTILSIVALVCGLFGFAFNSENFKNGSVVFTVALAFYACLVTKKGICPFNWRRGVFDHQRSLRLPRAPHSRVESDPIGASAALSARVNQHGKP